MSLLWCDGFDEGLTPAQLGWIGSGNGSTSTASPRTGVAASSNLGSNVNLGRDLGADQHATVIAGAAVRMSAGAPSSLDDFMVFSGDAGVTVHITIAMKPDGALAVYRGGTGGTLLGTTAMTGIFTAGIYRYLEVKVVLHDTTGSVHIMLDGVTEILALTGIDTKNAGTETVLDRVEWRGLGGTNTMIDDVYILNGVDSGVTGAPNNDFLGDCRADTLLPSADTTPEDWTLSTGTDSFALIDEATPNGDTDYIESDVANEITRVELPNHPASGNEVFGIRVTSWARKDDAGAASFRNGIFSDATVANGADQALSTSYASYSDIFQDDPDGDVQWTTAAIDALKVQVEVR